MSFREWKEVSLDDLSQMKYGKMPDKKKIKEKGYPIFTGYRVAGYYEEYMYKEPVLVVVARGVGGTGDVKISPPKAYITNLSIILIFDENRIDLNFMYYKLRLENLRILDSGSAQSQITIADLKRYKVTIPKFEEQKTIAHILSTLDEKIEVNNQINKTLEKMTQAIFKQWFIDFEFPNEDGEPYQSSGGEMVESELGLVPKGWGVTELQDIAEITMGQSPKGTSYNENGEGMVFYQGRTDFKKRFPERRLFTTEPKRIAKKGNILLSVRAPVGDLNIANEDCCIGRGLGALNSKHGYDSYLLYTMFKLKEKFDVFNGEGTVFGSINKNDLCSLKIVKAPEDVIGQFEKVMSYFDKQIYTLEMESRNLAKIRDLLLPELMAGEVRISSK